LKGRLTATNVTLMTMLQTAYQFNSSDQVIAKSGLKIHEFDAAHPPVAPPRRENCTKSFIVNAAIWRTASGESHQSFSTNSAT
jgi:hypothetical protein